MNASQRAKPPIRSSLHEQFERSDNVVGSSDRGFGFVFAAVFGVLATLPLFGLAKWLYWAVLPATAFLILAFAAPATLASLNRIWMRFALLLNRVMQPIVMGLLFFAVITPFALVRRVFVHDPLRLRFDRTTTSYWLPRGKGEPTPSSISDQF